MERSTTRIGVIGHTGRGNYGHDVDTVWLDHPATRIVAVADADGAGLAAARKRLGDVAGFVDYRQMLRETSPDVVAICPRWIDQHEAMALAAIESGAKGILMEKPFCRSLMEADRIIEACRAKYVKLALTHQMAYSPLVDVVRGMIADGRIGRLLELHGRGKEDARGGGEDLWVLGSHVMNLMTQLAGEPRWCAAQVSEGGQAISRKHVREGNEGIGPLAGDQLTAMYGFDEGVTGYFASTRNAGSNPSRFGVRAIGSKGVIDITFGYPGQAMWLDDPRWMASDGKAWVPVSSAGPGKAEPITATGLRAGNLLAVKDLLAAIRDDRQPECGMYAGRWTIEMIAAVFESHRTNQRVTLPLQQRENPLTLLQ